MAYTDLDQRSLSVHSYLTEVTLLQNQEEIELLAKKWMEISESKIYLIFKIYYKLYLIEKNALLEVTWNTVKEICHIVSSLKDYG